MKTFNASHDFKAAEYRRKAALHGTHADGRIADDVATTEPESMKAARDERTSREVSYVEFRRSGLDCDAAFDAVAAKFGILSSRLKLASYEDDNGDDDSVAELAANLGM